MTSMYISDYNGNYSYGTTLVNSRVYVLHIHNNKRKYHYTIYTTVYTPVPHRELSWDPSYSSSSDYRLSIKSPLYLQKDLNALDKWGKHGWYTPSKFCTDNGQEVLARWRKVKLDVSLTQHCRGKQALNVGDGEGYVHCIYISSKKTTQVCIYSLFRCVLARSGTNYKLPCN